MDNQRLLLALQNAFQQEIAHAPIEGQHPIHQ
jgi:hypothetical protein